MKRRGPRPQPWSFLGSRFVQAILILIVSAVVLRYGIRPPAPWSVFTLYMAIVFLAVLIFVSADSDSWRSFVRPLWLVLVDRDRRHLRHALTIVIPLLLGYYAYTQAAARPQAPPELRAVHPAPPDTIQFRGKAINVSGADNPLRKDPAKHQAQVARGAEIYIRNCVYCHGDNLDGQGHFAKGFNPPPANFQDPGTIAMLQEAYLFWRIAKGGPGLPKESTPWNSVMPAWEDRLSEEQIWQVIMFLYDFTGQQPRRWEH
jgi:mono/diheme cytochrome c family protein